MSLGQRYEEHHRERRDEGDFVFVPERIPLFVEAIGRGARVLDLGCRSGALTKHFVEGNTVVGLDVDATALEKAAALGIEPVQGNVEDPLPFADGSFDLVISINTVHNLDRAACVRSLAEIERVTRRHRYVQVDSWLNESQREKFERWQLTAQTYSDPAGWRRLFTEAGYRGDYYWTVTE